MCQVDIFLTLVNDFTITSYAKLYCKKQFQRNLIQSSMYIGSISGLIIMNIVSDKYGRRFAFLIGNAFAVAGSLCNSNFT